MHITNVAIQKTNEDYNDNHGGKWNIKNLHLYVESIYGRKAVGSLFAQIRLIFYHSLKAVQQIMINDWHCFECYGYDIIIDSDLKPWLVEVNASPSLSTTTEEDLMMKTRLLRDIFEIVMYDSTDNEGIQQELLNTDQYLTQRKLGGNRPLPSISFENNFELLVDEYSGRVASGLPDITCAPTVSKAKLNSYTRKSSAQWK